MSCICTNSECSCGNQAHAPVKTCRCGRIKDYTEPVGINDTVHEGYDVVDGFCGPLVAHTIRDLEKHLRSAHDALKLTRKAIDRGFGVTTEWAYAYEAIDKVLKDLENYQ